MREDSDLRARKVAAPLGFDKAAERWTAPKLLTPVGFANVLEKKGANDRSWQTRG